MEPAEMLGTASQIAVTMAGFAGVVVVFGSRAVHEWSAIDKFRLRLLLGTSTAPLALCLIGLLLLATGLAPATIWSCCSGIVVASFAFNTATGMRTFARFSPDELKASGARARMFYLISLMGIAIALLQVYNITTLQAFWPFFSAVVLSIMISTLQFARMVLPRREPT